MTLPRPTTDPRRNGTVYIARDDGTVTGYWDGHPERAPGVIEHLPHGLDLYAAALWGLERTVRVLVRQEMGDYWAIDTDEWGDELPDAVEGLTPVDALKNW